MYKFKVKGEVVKALDDNFIVGGQEYKLFRVKVGGILFKALVNRAAIPNKNFTYFVCNKAVLTKQEMVEGTEDVVLRLDTIHPLDSTKYVAAASMKVRVNGLVRSVGNLREITMGDGIKGKICTFNISVQDTLSHMLYTLHAVAFDDVAEEMAKVESGVFMNVYAEVRVGGRHGVELIVSGFKITGKYVV